MEAIILAGGFGTRLQSRVSDVPKPMAPVAGRPFLAILLDYLAGSGFGSVVLSVGYRREAIRDYFGDRHGRLAIRYAVEEEPLGTGGAILHALGTAQADPVWILNGDTFVELDYEAMLAGFEGAAAPGPLMAMAVGSVPDASRYASVLVEGGRVAGFAPAGDPRGGVINFGVYLLRPALFAGAALPKSFSFERDFLAEAVTRLPVQAWPVTGCFIDIGIPEDYERAQTLLRGWIREA
jgi:D-glycero-alpha-D-manno-heptose 1-phosphate guanylyltransferase